jgi:hypothetical protein
MIRFESAANVTGQPSSRHAERLGAAKRGFIDKQ